MTGDRSLRSRPMKGRELGRRKRFQAKKMEDQGGGGGRTPAIKTPIGSFLRVAGGRRILIG